MGLERRIALVASGIWRGVRFRLGLHAIIRSIHRLGRKGGLVSVKDATAYSRRLRRLVQAAIPLQERRHANRSERQLAELRALSRYWQVLLPAFQGLRSRRVLFVGQCYYNTWYLSRALRDVGWSADVLNWDLNEASQIFYHGEDFRFTLDDPYDVTRDLEFFIESLFSYDVFHFSNAHGIAFGFPLQGYISRHFEPHFEIHILKALGKKIVYTNNGCLDGATRSGFATWGNPPICETCIWRSRPDVCGDLRNTQWAQFRNEVVDYQVMLCGNRVDFNCSPRVHEVPEFHCLDTELWRPDLDIPKIYRLNVSRDIVRLYHAVGNRELRTDRDGVNIKSTHIYLPLLDKLRAEGAAIQLLSPTNVPNREVRYIQAQADVFLEMLTFGWFGANAREALMLGKPVICYLRPEWLANIRAEEPQYVDELPIISATPETVESILRDIIGNPTMRCEIGRRSRDFAVKWHSSGAGARRMSDIYTRLLNGDDQLFHGSFVTPAQQISGGSTAATSPDSSLSD